MSERRVFLKGGAATVALAALGGMPGASAAERSAWKNIVFTADNQGIWEGKAYGHLPEITVAQGKVTVRTNHGMSEAHYIVRHTLLLEDGTFLGAAAFTPRDTPVSTYDLPMGYRGKLVATSFCNLHDLWLSETSV